MKSLLPLSFLICLLAGSCRKTKEPEFRRLESFAVKSFGLEKVEIGFRLTYFNPNSFSVSVKEADADFYLDSVYMGKITQDKEVEVAQNAEFSIPLSGSIPLISALKLKINDVENRELLVQANGSARVGRGGVFIKKPFKYSGKHKVDLKL